MMVHPKYDVPSRVPFKEVTRHRHYAIFFVEVEDEIRVVRVIHTARDVNCPPFRPDGLA